MAFFSYSDVSVTTADAENKKHTRTFKGIVVRADSTNPEVTYMLLEDDPSNESQAKITSKIQKILQILITGTKEYAQIAKQIFDYLQEQDYPFNTVKSPYIKTIVESTCDYYISLLESNWPKTIADTSITITKALMDCITETPKP